MTQRGNGGIIGVQNNPTLSAASGVWAVNEIQRAAVGATWPLAAIPDPNFRNVTLLLNGEGTNGAQNNTFIDSSTNNFAITRNGNTTQGAFSPYGNRWSNYFDGTGDWLSTASNAAFTLGSSGNFTVECFAYLNGSQSASFAVLMTTMGDFNSDYVGRWALTVNGASLRWYDAAGNVGISTTIPLNSWVHIAACRVGSTITLYINGSSVGTQTTNQAYTTQGSVRIGFMPSAAAFNGYISDARVVTGTAVYTANFTPPTAPLTAITGTQLLTCQSNRLIDNSVNNFTITRNGDVSVQRFSPYSPTLPYAAATTGGSGYFDGSDDLNAVSNAAFTYGTSDFTIEGWFYITGRSGAGDYEYLFGQGATTGSSSVGVYRQGGVLKVWNGSAVITGTTTLPLNTWNHIALSRSGTTMRLFLNGVQEGSATNSSSISTGSSNGISVGRWTEVDTNYIIGYVSNFRVVKGTAVYTSAFTPPTAPVTNITNTSLLCNFTNTGVVDTSTQNNLETVGNAQISTSFRRYGSGSLAFDGTGDWLFGPFTQNFNFGTGSFTWEAWVYPNSVSGIVGLFAVSGGSGANPKFVVHMNGGTPNIHYNNLTGGADIYTAATSAISANTWTHLAFVRNGSTWTWYINGVASGTGSNSTSISFTSQPVYVGYGGESYFAAFNGYIDDLRVTRGVARYTANFTPPTAQLSGL